MQNFKKHIALLFLAGFLCPQVMSSMHYLVVSHSYTSESNTDLKKTENSYLYHTCHYHLNSLSSVLPLENSFKNIDFITPRKISDFFSLENYVHQDDFNFQLRGPPLK